MFPALCEPLSETFGYKAMITHKAILVLGGNGFVGQNLIARLRATTNTEIYSVGREKCDRPVRGVCYKVASFDAPSVVYDILPRCDTIVHLASASTPGGSAQRPSIEAEQNILPTLRLLEAMQNNPTQRLLFLSTGGAIYGSTRGNGVVEDARLSPISYYGAGKLSLETFIDSFCKQFKRSAVILRPSNLYGQNQPLRKGFGIVPTVFHAILTSHTFPIWGDGETVRDYLYLDDFIDLCIDIILDLNWAVGAKVFNVGSGQGTSLNQLLSLIESITGKNILRDYQSSRAVDVQRIVLDTTRVEHTYQWHACTSLEVGLNSCWQLYSKK